MIRVYIGDDREKISTEVRKVLGADYEVYEGAELSVQDLMNIFQGASLFAEKRKILLKDLTPEPKKKGEEEDDKVAIDFYAEIAKYTDTPHTVVIWETRTPRKKAYTDLKKSGKIEELRRVNNAKDFDARKVFDVFEVAYRDGPRAVRILEEVKGKNDPYMFFGLMASQAIKKFSSRAGAKEKRVLRELSRLDMQMKTTSIEPWTLISSFLLQVSSL